MLGDLLKISGSNSTSACVRLSSTAFLNKRFRRTRGWMPNLAGGSWYGVEGPKWMGPRGEGSTPGGPAIPPLGPAGLSLGLSSAGMSSEEVAGDQGSLLCPALSPPAVGASSFGGVALPRLFRPL